MFIPTKLLSYLTLNSLMYSFLGFPFGLLELVSLLHLVLTSLLEQRRVEVCLPPVEKAAVSSCLEGLNSFP